MSVQSAMQFIRKVRTDESLQAIIKALGPIGDLRSVVEIAEAAGYVITVEELQTAFKHDWTMRWIYYEKRNKPI